MVSPKISIALVCLIALAIPYPSYTQNSPQDFQDAHNAARAQVRVGNMTWNSSLAASAQNYSNQRINDCDGGNSSTLSGNLATGNDSITAAAAVQLWLSGKADYDYNSNSCRNESEACLTYINVVWRNSTRLGCSRVQCKNSTWLITCYYDPPSDFPDERPY